MEQHSETQHLIFPSTWDLRCLVALSGGCTSSVFRCDSSFGPAVVKLNANVRDLDNMVRAQQLFGDELCTKIFGYSPENCAVLMEHFENDNDLSKIFPDEEKEIAVWLKFYEAICELPSVTDGFPTLAQFAEVFTRVTSEGAINKIMQQAWEHREQLMGNDRLLHGDLHHFNILNSKSGDWRMIDPHGVIGNPLYEVGAFLRNPWPKRGEENGLVRQLKRRVALLAQRLNERETRISLFGFYGAAFSIAWDIEDEIPVPANMVCIAEVLYSMATDANLRE